MRHENNGPVWLTIAVIIVGIGSVIMLSTQPRSTASALESNPPGMRDTAATVEQPVASEPTKPIIPTATVLSTVVEEMTPILLPTPTTTSLPPLTLPDVPVPENGQIYILHPTSPSALGWVRSNDVVANHFGDYNVFAGVFDGQQHIGAIQFDLSTVPPGSPILYADLTLTGLASSYLADNGIWTVQMLNDWMDTDWTTRDYYWLAREDSGNVFLSSAPTPNELEIAKSNTFSVSPEGLSLLEARLFTGKVSFRVLGPKEGADNLFGWDSGFGQRSLGRAPVLRIVTGGPAPVLPPTPTPNYIIVTPIPADGGALLALAAERLTATAVATPYLQLDTPAPTLTPTPLPPNWVTPVLVTNTPTPENEVTAIWQSQVATAQAIVHGTATATPPNVWTATPTPLPPPPTPTPLIVAYDSLTATPTPTQTPHAIPDILHGKILFFSDRTGGSELMVMDPDGSNVAVWTGGSPEWIYEQATKRESMSPGGQYQVVVSAQQISSLQLWTIDLTTGLQTQITRLDDIAYDPVWSPLGNQIAFVSPSPGNDELFVINTDGSGLTQLTLNEWEWDKHPSWSPDGSQLVFWSNRETQRQQIWIMNADGTNVRNLSSNNFNDWDPVWVK